MHKKMLTEADLGWGGSHQTHIGLHEDMLSGWSDEDKVYGAYLFVDEIENCFACNAVVNAIVDGETGRIRSPKIKTGTFDANQNLLKLIRKNATAEIRYLTLGELPDGKLFVFLGKEESSLKKTVALKKVTTNPSGDGSTKLLSKPFLLLAGISGTGKTRFVREQARSSALIHELDEGANFCQVPVRPDWHEPSDLLGYVSRIGKDGDRYVPTNFLKFMVQAWEEIFEKGGTLNSVGPETCPFWLCLDEMNLAPVEQYFADYLSVLETRKWDDGEYSSEPLLTENLELVRVALEGDNDSPLWKAYAEVGGIPLPPNLIVAGTVNMDETTHGFSRKVIDRALTIDFQEFFPNNFDVFFEGQHPPVTLSYPVQSEVSGDQPGSYKSGDQYVTSLIFLQKVNDILQGTPFELAYRALNELYLAEVCFAPERAEDFQAVWDDYLMQKVLPRIEGDAAKLKYIPDPMLACESLEGQNCGKGTVLHALYDLLEKDLLKDVWDGERRPDLLRETDVQIECRSRQKLEWMMRRLKTNHFTDFWV